MVISQQSKILFYVVIILVFFLFVSVIYHLYCIKSIKTDNFGVTESISDLKDDINNNMNNVNDINDVNDVDDIDDIDDVIHERDVESELINNVEMSDVIEATIINSTKKEKKYYFITKPLLSSETLILNDGDVRKTSLMFEYNLIDDYNNMTLYETIKYLISNVRYKIYTRIFIRWLWNQDKFTDNNYEMFKRYDNYRKYNKIPYEIDDYDKPLLNESFATTFVDKYDDDSNMDIYETQTTYDHMNINNLFIHKSLEKLNRKSWIFIDNDVVEKTSLMYENNPMVLKYYVCIMLVSTCNPQYVISELIINKKNDINKKMNWGYITNRMKEKNERLCDLMAREIYGEYLSTGVKYVLNDMNLTFYQIFEINYIVHVKTNEPYISKIRKRPIVIDDNRILSFYDNVVRMLDNK
jgi:hypothetical protein